MAWLYAAGTRTPAPTQAWSGPVQLPACTALINASITPANGTFNQTRFFSQPPLVRSTAATALKLHLALPRAQGVHSSARAQACQSLGYCASAADLRINCTYCINQFAGLMAAWMPGLLAAPADGNMTSSGAGMWMNAAMTLKAQCNDTASNLQQLLGMASMIGTQMAPVFATGARNASAICLANQNVCDPGASQPT